jgi:transcriptional regulator with XRE-family HTH domain
MDDTLGPGGRIENIDRTVMKKQRIPEGQPGSEPGQGAPNALQFAIGREIRRYRSKAGLTVAALAGAAGLSPGMLSKVENGQISPSLDTLQALAKGLNVPLTSLFKQFEESADASYVPAGQGLLIERKGTRAGHQYQLLGHSVGRRGHMEPYLITIPEGTEVFPVFQHEGLEFLYILEGEMNYRYGNHLYTLKPGDSLHFDSGTPHGPEDLLVVPMRFICVMVDWERE